MRALHVIAGLRVGDGGPAYSVPSLCRALTAAGAEVDLMAVSESALCTERGGRYRERRFGWDYSRIPVLRELRASSSMARALRHASAVADVIHDHGLWLMPNVYAGWEAARAQTPLVVAPRGMLSPAALSFSRIRKIGFWRLLQKGAIARTASFHATSEQEHEDIRAFGLMQPVAILPNGIDIENVSDQSRERKKRQQTVLFLGRIHPIKGLDSLVRAWAKIQSAHPDWSLRIVGSSPGAYRETLKGFVAEQGIARVSIEDAVYGPEKSRLFREASLFVLPSLTENFGLSVAEALAAGVPAIATKGTPWSGLAKEGCGWWIDHGVESLAAALPAAMLLPAERLADMGEKGRAWMARDFSWDRVARDMLDLYAWLAGGADKPAFVRCG